MLIADGNYPFSTGSLSSTPKIYLNLMPGVPTVTLVLEAILTVIEVEAVQVMIPADASDPPIFAEFQRLLPPSLPFVRIERLGFYSEVKSTDTCLIIATGEQRTYANILLKIRVRT